MFWNTEKLQIEIPKAGLVEPYDESHIKHAAYQLSLGSEAFLTSADDEKKEKLEVGDPIVIPPGQFALLLTEETVRIPTNAMGLISMRFGVKRRGLINVSGFHVDPGYANRLKFSVYNAGSQSITLTRGDQIFMLWIADLSDTTEDVYKDKGPQHDTITSDDQNVMHGEVASPAQLRKDIEELRHWYGINKTILLWILAMLGAIFVRILFL